MYLTWTMRSSHGGYGPRAWETGQLIFRVLSVSQAVLIALIAPALTCGAISLERERQTMDFLLMTPLRAVSIVWGKLMSAFLFVGLLLVLSMPLASVSFLLGGVSPGELAAVYTALIVEAVLLCSFGLAWSATFSKTTASTPLAYATTLAYMAATAMLYGMGQGLRYGSRGATADTFIFSGLNPICLPFISAEKSSLFGWHLPVGVPGVALNLILTLAVLSAAVHRVASLRGNSHATAARLLTCFAVVAGCTVFAGDLAARASAGRSLEEWAWWMTGLLITAVALTGLLAPVFATGEPPAGVTPRQALGRALNPLRAFHGEPQSAASYLVLMLVLTLPAVAGSIASMGGSHSPPGARSLAPSSPSAVVTRPAGPGATTRVMPSRPTPPAAWSAPRTKGWCWGVVKDLYVLMICAVLAYVAIGWAASAVTGNRWAAMGVSFALVLGLMLVPLTGFSDISSMGDSRVGGYGNILYTSPHFGAAQMVDQKWLDNRGITGFWFEDLASFDKVTLAIHLGLCLAFASLAGLALSARLRNTRPVTQGATLMPEEKAPALSGEPGPPEEATSQSDDQPPTDQEGR